MMSRDEVWVKAYFCAIQAGFSVEDAADCASQTVFLFRENGLIA